MAIEILSPSNLPLSRAKNGSSYLRVAKNTVHLSASFVDAMKLKIGDKVSFLKKGGLLYIYATTVDDAYVLKGKPNDVYFCHHALAQKILAEYSCTSLLEKQLQNSVKFDVKHCTFLPSFVAGVDNYWEIVPPKKYQSP